VSSLSAVVRCLEEPCQLSPDPRHALGLAAGKKRCCVAYPATKLSSAGSRDVTQPSSRGSTGADGSGAFQAEAKQKKEGKGSAVYTTDQLRRHWDLTALNYKQVHVTNIMGGCLGLIFNQLGSQRAAALWDVRNSFPLRKAGSGKADSR